MCECDRDRACACGSPTRRAPDGYSHVIAAWLMRRDENRMRGGINPHSIPPTPYPPSPPRTRTRLCTHIGGSVNKKRCSSGSQRRYLKMQRCQYLPTRYAAACDGSTVDLPDIKYDHSLTALELTLLPLLLTVRLRPTPLLPTCTHPKKAHHAYAHAPLHMIPVLNLPSADRIRYGCE